MAASLFNLAALMASDCGLPDLARQWCHDHAAVYSRVHWDARAARSALEPLVNIARLQIRAGQGQAAFELLDTLYDAVSNRTATNIDGIRVPGDLPLSAAEHRELRQWLWGVHLADGTRALAADGQWQQAYQHLTKRKGIGERMLDGRQVAVLAHAASGDYLTAKRLVDATQPGERWEAAVAACLRVQSTPADDLQFDACVNAMVQSYLTLAPIAAPVVTFHTRLGLAVLDAADPVDYKAVIASLVQGTVENPDGHAVRDLLADPRCASALTAGQDRSLRAALVVSGIDAGFIRSDLRADLSRTLRVAERILMGSLKGGPRPR